MFFVDSKMYRSNEVISTTASFTTNGEMSPAISTSVWSPMSPRRKDSLNEVASKEVDEALTHAEVRHSN